MTEQRKKFEAWAKANGYDIEYKRWRVYRFAQTGYAWDAWQAATEVAEKERIQPTDLRECGCGWRGESADCVWCGSVGPLCPKCHETTEEAHQPASAQPVAVPDERAAFEAWARSKAYSVRKFPSGDYYEQHETGCAWDAWQARAQLSAATKPVAVPDEWINTVNAAAIALEAAFAHVPAGTGDPSCRANLVPTLSALRDMHRAMLSAAPKPEGVE